jgi:hypothetical protein
MCSPIARRRRLRPRSGSRASCPPTTSSVQHAIPKITTIARGPRTTELLVAVAEIESGSIAIASIIPSDTIERAIAPSPTRTPLSLRSTPTLTR